MLFCLSNETLSLTQFIIETNRLTNDALSMFYVMWFLELIQNYKVLDFYSNNLI